MTKNLVDKLSKFNAILNEAEQANYKLLLGLAAGALSPKFESPIIKKDKRAFNTVGECLAKLQPYSHRITANGIAWRGRPPFMTDQLLADLQREAREIRKDAIDNVDHFLGCGAPIANYSSTSNDLIRLVREHAGEVLPTGVASFIFYDRAGQGIDPHIDTDIFSLNVILMLEHVIGVGAPSNLVLFPPNSPPERVDLQVGEIIIMFAGSIAHGREYIKPGEKVSILTFGFHPLGI